MPRHLLRDSHREQARNHVALLAARHRVKLVLVTRDIEGYEACFDTREAFVPYIESALDYLVTLHEIGHLASMLGLRYAKRDDDAYYSLLSEGAAWSWAAAAAIPTLAGQLTRKDREDLYGLFGSHLDWSMRLLHPISAGKVSGPVRGRRDRRLHARSSPLEG